MIFENDTYYTTSATLRVFLCPDLIPFLYYELTRRSKWVSTLRSLNAR